MSWGYRPYVSVAERKAQALKEMEKLRKKGKDIQPIEIEGRKITRNFWGKAWCDHLEALGEYDGRIDRGRTYVRNGSVCHLGLKKGEISAYVSGSELYQVKIKIDPLAKKKWQAIKGKSTNQIGSLLDLLQGKIPATILETVINQKDGLFPTANQIHFDCDCPDYAYMCKHIAAVLYGVGARLDVRPELLFELRGVDVGELIDSDVEVANATSNNASEKRTRIAVSSLEEIFGIEIVIEEEEKPKKTRAKKKSVSKTSSRLKPIHSQDVIKLRKKFKMTQKQFAKLVGVSSPLIGKWERDGGELNLKEEPLRRFKAVQKLTIAKAHAEIGR